MRILALAFSCLTAAFASSTLAGGQDVLSDPSQAIDDYFWKVTYASGGTNLYCGEAFAPGDTSNLTASYLYNVKQIKSALRCMTETQCTVKTPKYQFMLSDLHNIYPVPKQMEEARRNAVFGSLQDSARTPSDLGCGTRATYHLIEPSDQAKGNIARAFFYMHDEYRLPLPNDLDTLKQWNKIDPPDTEEMARNERIAGIQGLRNRFIDNPTLADSVTP
jgi:deoxyribonuclease-1